MIFYPLLNVPNMKEKTLYKILTIIDEGFIIPQIYPISICLIHGRL